MGSRIHERLPVPAPLLEDLAQAQVDQRHAGLVAEPVVEAKRAPEV
jgi:hypothetical protein